MSTPLSDYLDRLAQYAHERFRVEMAEARRDYFKQIGANPENREYYEEVMKAYLDWFIFERPLEDIDRTPLGVFVQETAADMTADECAQYAEFLKAWHGLFLVRKVHAEAVECKDLFSGEIVTIAEDNPAAFLKGEVFDARVLPFAGEWRFGELLRFHPKRAAKLIQNVAKGMSADETEETRDLFLRLAQCKMKQYLFPRIDPLQFYKEIL